MSTEESKLVITVDTKKAKKGTDALGVSLGKTTKKGNEATTATNGLSDSSNKLGGMLKGLAVGFGALKFGSFVKGVIDYGDSLQKTSLRIGITTEALSQLNHAAEISGVSQEGLENSLKFISKNSAEAAQGVGTAVRAFDQLGLSAEKMIQLTPDEQLLIVAEAMEKVETSAEKTQIAMNIFGRSGAEMNQLMSGGADSIRELMVEADQLGLTLGTNTANAAAEFNDTIARLKGGLRGAGFELVENMLPAMQGFADAMSSTGSEAKGLNAIFAGVGKTLGTLIMVTQQAGENLGNVGAIIGAIVTGEFKLIPKIIGNWVSEVGEFAGGVADLWTGVEDGTDVINGQSTAVQHGTVSLKDYTNEAEKAADITARLARESKALETTFNNFVFTLDEGAKKAHDYEQAFLLLEKAQEKLGISSERAGELLQLFVESQGKDISKSLEESMRAVEDARNDIVSSALETGQVLAGLLGDELADGEADWSDFAQHVIKQIGRIIVQMVALKAIQNGVTAIGGAAPVPNADGNVIPGGVQKFGNGSAFGSSGIVSTPTLFGFGGGGTGVMGEAGTEAIMPLSRGADGKLGVKASGGGSTIINIDASQNVAGNADQNTVEEMRALQDSTVNRTVQTILQKMNDGGRMSRTINRRS